ncbi:MAG: sulfate ABC transporter permease subunit CysT [Candidatus Xenobia bacterium]
MSPRPKLPGFGLTLGTTVLYLGLVVLVPLSMLLVKTSAMGPQAFWEAVSSPRAVAAYRLTFGAALLAALVNLGAGLLVAWVLARYEFPGKRVVDAFVDFPFALPTAVAGITLTTLYAPEGWLGRFLAPLGIKAAFTPLGIVLALIFITFPFVVRTVEPVLRQFPPEVEEAAASLGASRWQSFWQVILPTLVPALLTGFSLALARAIGEYGSVIFIAGNLPMKTEIAPLLIMIKLEQYDYAGATAIALVLLGLSFSLLLLTNALQALSARRIGQSL